MHFSSVLYGMHYRSTRHCDLVDVSFYDCHNSFSSFPTLLSILLLFFFIHASFFYDSAPTVEFFDVIQIARCASFFLKFHTNVCLYYFITRYYIFANHRAVNIIFFHN